MNRSKMLTGMVTLFAFLSNMGTQAQTSSGSGPSSYQFNASSNPTQNNIPTFNPVLPNLNGAGLDAKLAACGGASMEPAIGLIKTATQKSSSAAAPEVSTASCSDPKTFKGKVSACSLKCDEPSVAMPPSCDSYYQEVPDWTPEDKNGSKTQYRFNAYQGYIKGNDCGKEKSPQGADGKDFLGYLNLKKDKQEVDNYVEYLRFKSTVCVKNDKDSLVKQYQAYDCMTRVLAEEAGKASGLLMQALQKNNEQYEKMNAFVQQVGDQMRQIDEILGPEDGGNGISKIGGDQFQGLLGMQAKLNKNLSEMIQNESDFKTAVAQVQKDTDANEQTLEADRMGVVSSCMKGERNIGVSGARSLMCYKAQVKKDGTPVVDSSGAPVYAKQSCGGMEYVRSLVEQSAFVNGNRGVMKSASRREKSQELTAQFDSMLSSINRDLGDYDQASSDGKLTPRTVSWNDISKKYAADMAELSSKTGVNVTAQMNSIAGHCFNDSYTWKKQQQKSAASNYSKNRQKILESKNKLNAQLNKGLADLNSNYGSVMAVLSGQAVTLNRFQCTESDSSKMSNCYSQIRQNIQNLLEGNGQITTTAKTITGGSMIPGFSVSCRGINGCVTAFQNVRKAKKEQTMLAQKAKAEYVQSGNSQVQQQLSSFGAYVGKVQQRALDQYAHLKGMLDKFGAIAPDAPNFSKGEALEPSVGPDKQPGPFKIPADRTKVIAGAVPAPGMIDLQDSGLNKLKEAAAGKLDKQATDLAEKMKPYIEGQKKLVSFLSPGGECHKGDVTPPSCKKSSLKSVENDADSEVNCADQQKACDAKLTSLGEDPNSPVNNETNSVLISILKTVVKDPATKNKVANEISRMKKNCSDEYQACLLKNSSKKQGGGDDSKEKDKEDAGLGK